MKIALLTIWHVENYGGELQAYATIKVLKQLGHEVEMIDIRLSDCIKSNLKGKISSIINYIGPSKRKFRRFWKDYIPITRRYFTIQQLQDAPPKADVYMVGSDQVWNPDLTRDFSTLYFLDFGNNNICRVSYASSFGTSAWNHPELNDRIKILLHRFKTITCREQSGVNLLKDVFGVYSKNVIDPTLLLEDYSDLIGQVNEKNTLVYYPLDNDPELETYAEELAQKLNLVPINNKHCSYVIKRIVWDRVSIEDWVRNIAEARFVLTRSFHGMAFAIIHKRQFAVIAGKEGRSIRLQNLLCQLGLEDRFFNNINELEISKPWDTTINYDKVSLLLKLMRDDSMLNLQNMLKL